MAQRSDSKPTLMADAERPLVLVGPPSALRGQFQVQNPTARKIVIRQPRVVPKAPTARAKGAMALPARAMALRRIVVRPGQTRPVPVALQLDPTTPPGTYHAELDVDGEVRTVVIHVTEDVAVSFAPHEIVVPNHPGDKVTKRVVVTNEGNVPWAVKSIGSVVLDEELAHCRALRGALVDVGDTMTKLDDFMVALGRRYRAIYETLALKVHNEKVMLAPGETQPIDLTITLPDKLDARARYTAVTHISTSALTITVAPQ